MGNNNASLPDVASLLAAGIDPKTHLPVRLGCDPYQSMKSLIRIQDEQDAVNRYKWTRFPCMTGQELERILYYKGTLAFFFFEEIGKFMILPYSLNGTIDVYGRYNTIKPVPIGSAQDEEDADYKKRYSTLATALADKKLIVVKEVLLTGEASKEVRTGSAVLLWDYTPQISQKVLSREQLNAGLISIEAECLPYMSTALAFSTGVSGLRVPSEDSKFQASAVSQTIKEAALKGIRYVPLVGSQEFQDLAPGTVGQAEEYLLAMQAIDNLRLGTHGLDNGGLFQKKAHVLQDEANVNSRSAKTALIDGLNQRRRFCDIVNSIWGLSVWCEINEDVSTDETPVDDGSNDGSDPGNKEDDEDGFGNN